MSSSSISRTVLSLGAFVPLLTLFAACSHDGLGSGSDGGIDGGPTGVACSKLSDEASCRARTDCVADTCFACSCTPSFAGCRAASETPFACPALGCATPQCCHTTNDCSAQDGFAFCQVPPINAGCGACFNGPGNCTKDADCLGLSSGRICEPTPCACPSSGMSKTCVPGCSSDSDCLETASCSADLRCHDRPCDAACTGNYACDPTGARCIRKACKTDGDCGKPGYCIEGACSKSIGQCIQPAA